MREKVEEAPNVTIMNSAETLEIVIDRRNHTSKEGIFAAGDVTDVIEKQVIIAAGEGVKVHTVHLRTEALI